MSYSWDVEIKDSGVVRLLERAKEQLKNLQPVMGEIGEIGRSSIEKNFAVGGRPEKWKTSKRALAMGGQTLVDRSILKNSITKKAFETRAEIGTNVVYAAIHHFGGKAGRGRKVTIPARPYLMIQDEDWPGIKKALMSYIVGRR